MSKYKDLITDLNAKISGGYYKVGQRIPTEDQLTKIYNVSRITVKKALAELSSKGAIARYPKKGTFVREIVPEAAPKKKIIGCVLANLLGEMVHISHASELALALNNCYFTMRVSDTDAGREAAMVGELVDSGVDGLLVYPVNSVENVDLYCNLLNRKFPVVFLDRSPMSCVCTCVTTDGTDISYRAVEYLVDHGHRNIAFIGYDDKITTVLYRLQGYISAMKSFHLPFAEKYHPGIRVYLEGDGGQFEDDVLSLLNLPDPPTAFYCVNDHCAMNLIRVLNKTGKTVPEDYSVIGHDDVESLSNFSFSLTTFRQPYEEIGQKAANELLKLIYDPNATRRMIFLNSKLIERNSVKRI